LTELPFNSWSSVPTFGAEAALHPRIVRPSAYGLIRNEAGLLALARTPEGVFLPGGGIEGGESPAEAVVREAMEECGLVVRPGAWTRRAVDFVTSAKERTHFEKRCTFVAAELEAIGPSEGEPDHELQWAEPAVAQELVSHPSHRWAIATWRAEFPLLKN
jgi:8-oxo-dGTP diphosphatase